MEITSFHFLIFVVIVLGVYHALPRRGQNLWLLIASYAFYVFWSWQFAILLLVATLFHFELAKHLRKDGQGRVALLWLGIGADLVLFMVFKASSFYLYRLATLLEQSGVQSGLGALQIVIPLGMSYYILQNISYLIDVFRGQIQPSTNRVDFALYLAYFPKMVAGPIERARTFLPILAKPRQVDNQVLARALVLILIGLTRKLLIANLLFAHLPWDDFIGNSSIFSRFELFGWLVVYAFGLYNDFAGYTNIVRGVSLLFGIELSANFNAPYFSRSITEFWNRWHITLSQWLRDYIFFPVNRALAKRFGSGNMLTMVIPPMLTMLVSGFWHGPNWQMLVWGGLHGTYLVGERLLTARRSPSGGVQNRVWAGQATQLFTFLLVAFAWVPFAMRMPFAIDFWQQLLVGNNVFGLINYRLLFSLIFLIPSIWLDTVQSRESDETAFFLHQTQTAQAALLATVIVLLLVVTSSGAGQPFIYQGF